MTTTTAVFLPLRAARRLLGHVERTLRPADATWPGTADEAPATRASRQAQRYLERRRRQLNDQLEAR